VAVTVIRTANGRAQPVATSNFELYAWYFMRISGVLLVFLALGHFAIMHVINSVDVIDYEFAARRWLSPLWRLYDWFLLMLALLHGLNGLRVVLDDYVRGPMARTLAQSALWVLGIALLIIGTEVIITFQPAIR
jgi:succinate dehydrogenase / fumarate reductase membrane anchor subunit